jgi:hypothetical protein
MRKLITFALVAATPALFATAPVGASATASARAAVQIVSPISLQSNGMLDFGKVVVADPSKDVVLELAGVSGDVFTGIPTYTNAALLNSTPSVAVFHARYDALVGWAGLSVTTDPSVSLTGANGSVTLVPKFVDGTQRACVIWALSPGQEAKHLPVGGTLTATAGTFGAFSGTFNVTVAYN